MWRRKTYETVQKERQRLWDFYLSPFWARPRGDECKSFNDTSRSTVSNLIFSVLNVSLQSRPTEWAGKSGGLMMEYPVSNALPPLLKQTPDVGWCFKKQLNVFLMPSPPTRGFPQNLISFRFQIQFRIALRCLRQKFSLGGRAEI